eukprot:sb/3473657/
MWFLDDIPGLDDRGSYLAAFFLLVVLEFAVPVPIVLVSCIISVRKLIQSQRKSKKGTATYRMKKEATCTILWLTGVFLLFNIPLCIYFTTDFVYQLLEKSVNYSSYLLVFLTLHTIFLNSLCNTIVYIVRTQRRRLFGDGSGSAIELT